MSIYCFTYLIFSIISFIEQKTTYFLNYLYILNYLSTYSRSLMSMMKHNIAHKTLEQTFHNVFFNRKNVHAQNSTTLIKIKSLKIFNR